MKVRVISNPDKSVIVIHPAPKSKRLDETEDKWLERVFSKATPEGLPYKDIDSSELPTREDRNAWEYDIIDKKIKVNSVKAEKIRKAKEREEKIKSKIREIAIKEIDKEK